jgi:hypothetical protein
VSQKCEARRKARRAFTLSQQMEDEMLSLKRHKRGSAYCRHNGKCYWFGRYGTRESRDRFEAWLATTQSEAISAEATDRQISLLQLASRFMEFATVSLPQGRKANRRG